MTMYREPIDTDMAKDFPMDKSSPKKIANRVSQAIEESKEDIFPLRKEIGIDKTSEALSRSST